MERICNNCKHYRRHYFKMQNMFHQVADGHCVYPRLKLRKFNTEACPNYAPLEPQNGRKKAPPNFGGD
jgi:hypothetical protein